MISAGISLHHIRAAKYSEFVKLDDCLGSHAYGWRATLFSEAMPGEILTRLYDVHTSGYLGGNDIV